MQTVEELERELRRQSRRRDRFAKLKPRGSRGEWRKVLWLALFLLACASSAPPDRIAPVGWASEAELVADVGLEPCFRAPAASEPVAAEICAGLGDAELLDRADCLGRLKESSSVVLGYCLYPEKPRPWGTCPADESCAALRAWFLFEGGRGVGVAEWLPRTAP